VGREPMRERLAMVVSTKAQLVDILNQYCQGSLNIENVERGRMASKALILDDVEGRQYLDSIIRNRKLNKLTQLWTSGVDFDWEALHAGVACRRVALPTYAFERRRYWIDESRPIVVRDTAASGEIDSRVSGRALDTASSVGAGDRTPMRPHQAA